MVPSVAEPFVTLISGISSEDAFYKHSAYLELTHLSGDESSGGTAARTAFFADQKYNPSLWSQLCRIALLDLGKDYQLVLRRGKPTPPGLSVIVTRPVGFADYLPQPQLQLRHLFRNRNRPPLRS